MTTQTTPTQGPKTARVEVTYDFDLAWVQLRNLETRNTMTLLMDGRSPEGFTQTRQRELWAKLTGLDNGSVHPLTARELHTFVRMVKGEREPDHPFLPMKTPEELAKPELQPEPLVKPGSDPLHKSETATAGNAVGRMFAKSHTVANAEKGLELETAALGTLTKLGERLKGDYVTFFYYIPASLDTECPNPSATLWSLGMVRLDGSVWTCRKETLGQHSVQNLMRHWDQYRDKGLFYYHLDVGEGSMETLRREAQARLEEEVRRVHTALVKNIMAADDRLQKVMAGEKLENGDVAEPTPAQIEAGQDKRDGAVRGHINNAAKQLDNMIACAARFDDTMEVEHLLEGLRAGIRSLAESFNAEMYLKRKKFARTV